MAVTSNLNMHLTLTGDTELDDNFSFVENQASPGQNEIQDLISGDNTITIPKGGSSVPVGCIIIPPSGNVVVLTLKGIGADTGIAIHPSNPTCISLSSAQVSFVINVTSDLDGFRFNFF